MAYDEVLKPPSATDDVLHTAELIRIVATTVYEPTTISGADELIQRLRTAEPRFFGNSGNRRGGTGEFLLLLKPTPQGDADAIVEVWMRHRDRTWSLSKTEPLHQAGGR
jgi:hypothetical protein